MRPVGPKDLLEFDKNLQAVVLQCYSCPEQVVYQAAKNDYSEIAIHNTEIPVSSKCGEWIVESLLSNERGHYGCYSSDTEVLTEEGWVRWEKITSRNKLAAYNTSTKDITFEYPSAVQKWNYDGPMYHLSNPHIDLLVSPDHRIIYLPEEEYNETFEITNVKVATAEQFYNMPKRDYIVLLDEFVVTLNTKETKEEWEHYKGTIHCATVSTGALVVRRHKKAAMVCGNCLEHPQITFSVAGYVHSVMVQARTHRVGVSFDCQSQRYTGKRVLKVASGELDPRDVFYVRPPGFYVNRKGKKYDWTEVNYNQELEKAILASQRYAEHYANGVCEEHIRDYLPQSIRQNFVVSFNLRSVLHFLDLRAKKDAQLEIGALCEQLVPLIRSWAPNVWNYYEEKRLYKARLSP